MDKRSTVALFIDLLEINNKFAWVVLSVCKDFGTKESDDMVADDFTRFVLEVGVVDTEIGVEPVDFVGHEFLRNETLQKRSTDQMTRATASSDLCGDFLLNKSSLLFFALEDGGRVSGLILDAMRYFTVRPGETGHGEMRVRA